MNIGMSLWLLSFLSVSRLVFSEMSLDEKIGQLLMAPACPLRDKDHRADWQILLREYHIGGALLKKSDVETQLEFLNWLQTNSNFKLLIAADAEWGLSMRMSDAPSFPKNMTLGAIQNLDLLYEFGKMVAIQAKSVGVHLNLAPVADVNTNPENPVIGMRSFGDDPEKVSRAVCAVVKGFEQNGLLACVKHFPGHGDTFLDSHTDLPKVRSLPDLTPFKRAIREGVSSIMSAHIVVEEIDPENPMTLSPHLRKILREEIGFQGLIISDALNMKAITYSPEKAAILARKAGCDLLLYGSHQIEEVDVLMRETIPRVFLALKEAYFSGELDLRDLDESVERILKYKQSLQTHTPKLKTLFTLEARLLKKRLYRQAVTLIGKPHSPENQVIWVKKESELAQKYPEKTTICLLANPYALMKIKLPETVILGFEDDPDAESAVRQVLEGGPAFGLLPFYLLSFGE